MATNNTIIRPATESDMIHIYNLVHELAIYENAPEEHWQTPEKYLADFKDKAFECQLLEVDDTVVGMILYYEAYSTWKGKMLYLDDFIITERYRRKGYGELLMNKFLDIAREKDVTLVFWQVLEWNEPAINFYKKYAVIFDKEWTHVKMILKQNPQAV